LKGRPLKITFWGPNDLVGEDGELTGEHFIESRTFAWGNRVKHLVRSQDSNMKRLVRYLTEPGKGRIAIVPSLVDSSAFFVHQALRAGVPVMASNVRSVQEIVHIQDRREVLFAANDTVALARKMLDAWNNGSTSPTIHCD
jgi:glycosyltransferase involved in cell wall biosynthesis